MQALADAIDYVRQRPERFFRGGSPEPVELVTHIVGEVLILGGSETCTMRSGDWWMISSNVYWLKTCPDYAPEELFFHIVAFPEAGPHSMRAEILLTAFAQQVVTVSANHQSIIKGDVSQANDIWRLLASRPDWKRTVAFRFAPACG
ncbi:MAG TPA: hypothetical protein VLQ80_31725 [Candidatus Saccharimonadia bacterium]|nr:hypothetical protein [Candidatus Saccharimonadia bacterium]